MTMKYFVVLLCLAGIALGASYNDWQQGAAEGLKMGFKLGEAYNKAQGGVEVDAFNAFVDTYNAWVRENFGEDANLLMKKMEGPIDLTKPTIIANNTTQKPGVVHKIDGGVTSGPKYKTNDMNLLPDSVRQQVANGTITTQNIPGGDFLGGI